MAAFPAIKVAYSQTKHGLKITFEVDQNDMPAEIAGSALGTPYMVAAVETNAETGQPKEPVAEKPDKPKKHWHEMLYSQRAGIRCSDTKFKLWLSTRYPNATCDAAELVRKICGVTSRADLNENHEAAEKFDKLDTQYLMDTGQLAEARA